MITITLDGPRVVITRGEQQLVCPRDEAPALMGQLLAAFGLGGDVWRRGYAAGHADGLEEGRRRARREAETAARKHPAIDAAARLN